MKLSDYLSKAGTKPIEFARSLGVTPSMISRLIRGERGASLDLALRIEAHTNGEVAPADLLREPLPIDHPDILGPAPPTVVTSPHAGEAQVRT